MQNRFLIFISIIALILTLSSFYIGVRIVTRTSWGTQYRGLVWLTFGIFILLQFAGPLLYRTLPDYQNRLFVLSWLIYTSLGVFACMFFYTLVGDLILSIAKFFLDSARAQDLERRHFILTGGLTLASSIVGVAQAKSGPHVFEVDIPIRNLPAEFEDYKILQISDLHVGPTIGRSYVENVVEISNRQEADLVALTGDFVDGSVAQLREAVAPLANLKSKDGRFFVTGNHEYYWGATEWIAEQERLGATHLLNKTVLIERNGAKFALAGVTDLNAGQMISEHSSDPALALANIPKDIVKILLAHQPGSYKAASLAGVDLQLSGHTHAGQFFPWNILVKFVHRYYKGLNRHEKMWVYVSRGTGYWGPPLRLGVPPEITLIRLKRA